jgi:hypothetical protein
MYNEIWSASVPPKVRIFPWRLSQNGLATQENRQRRSFERDARCQICGVEDESGFHAVVRCTKATALRHEMRNVWVLPNEQQFQHSGPDWLPLLLCSVDGETKAKTLLLWRAWHLRNDAIHGKGLETVYGSARFLTSYALSLNIAGQAVNGGPSDGKSKIQEGAKVQIRRHKDEADPLEWRRSELHPQTDG